MQLFVCIVVCAKRFVNILMWFSLGEIQFNILSANTISYFYLIEIYHKKGSFNVDMFSLL